MQKSGYIYEPKAGRTSSKVNSANAKVSRANAQSRPSRATVIHQATRTFYPKFTPEGR